MSMYVLDFEGDILFLLVHLHVITMARENLKRMVSTCTVSLTSKRDAKKIQVMVGNLERVTYRSFTIPKEVKQSKHNMRINGKFVPIIQLFLYYIIT